VLSLGGSPLSLILRDTQISTHAITTRVFPPANNVAFLNFFFSSITLCPVTLSNLNLNLFLPLPSSTALQINELGSKNHRAVLLFVLRELGSTILIFAGISFGHLAYPIMGVVKYEISIFIINVPIKLRK